MAQKLLLFWRKPARRCWWEGVELEDVEGVPGKLKVWIRRVWTLEMVSPPCSSLEFLLLLTSSTERDWPPITDGSSCILEVHIQIHLPCKSYQSHTYRADGRSSEGLYVQSQI